MNSVLLVKLNVLRNMDVRIVLLVVEDHVIIVDHRLAILAVPVSGLNVPDHPLDRWDLN
jgi:hypothetical protein